MASLRRALPLAVVLVLTGVLSTIPWWQGDGSPPAVRSASLEANNVVHGVLWAAENESVSHVPTKESAVAHARSFTSILALHDTYQGHVGPMRAANPEIRLLAYVMGTYAWKEQAPGWFPESWYLKDASGAYVRSKGVWPDHYLMDPTEEGWITNRTEMCSEFLRSSGYDGCSVDILGLASLDPRTVTGIPIYPRTDAPWEPTAWLRATSNLAARIKEAVEPALIVGNGLNSGPVYFSREVPSSRLLSDIDGGIAEAWLRGAFDDVGRFPSLENWQQNVDMLVDAASRGKFVMTNTKVWVQADLASVQAWHRFALASFLLGAEGTSSFSFSAGRFDDPMTPFGRPIDLGSPLGPYRQAQGVFERSFELGSVFVNPSSVPVLIDLIKPFVTPEGISLSDQLTIPPHTGEILLEEG